MLFFCHLNKKMMEVIWGSCNIKIDRSENGDDSFLTIDNDDELDAVFEQFKIRMDEEFEFLDN